MACNRTLVCYLPLFHNSSTSPDKGKDRNRLFIVLFFVGRPMSRDATFGFFLLFCTSSFEGGKWTDSDGTIVVKASGGQTLTMVYIYYGTCVCNSVWAVLLVFGCCLARITPAMNMALIHRPKNLSALLPDCRRMHRDFVKYWTSLAVQADASYQ